MLRRIGTVLLLLCGPVIVRAAEPPEQLLPASTQVYLRWDGVAAHPGTFDKSALGKILQGDTGKFLTHALEQAQDALGSELTTQELLRWVPPARLKQLLADAAEAPKLLSLLGTNGFVVAVEVRSVEPLRGQVTFIVPGAGAKARPLFGALRLATALAKQEIKEKKIDGTTVSYVESDGKTTPADPLGTLTQAWWLEGEHAVLVAGTDPVEDAVKRMHEKTARLTDTPQFKRLAEFKEFETVARGMVDVAGLVKVAAARNDVVAKILESVGLDGIKTVRLYSGFEGEAERGIMEMELAPGARKGVLSLLRGKPFKLSDLPPLPDDLSGWTATTLDLGAVYDEGFKATETILGIVAPDQVPLLKETVTKVTGDLGVNPRKDLLDHLGDRFVQYSSPGEGIISFGQVYLFSVRDEKKLLSGLDQLVKGIARVSGADVGLRKRDYRGVEVREINVRLPGFIFVPSYAVVNGWLAVSFYPQPVHGLILRTKGEVPAWKPDARTREAFEKLPKEFVSVSVSDPRPTVKTVLSVAPLAIGAVRSFLPESRLEVGLLPNSHEVNRHLFPNVSVSQMDGDVLRLHTRGSLSLPLDANSPEALLLFGVLSRVR